MSTLLEQCILILLDDYLAIMPKILFSRYRDFWEILQALSPELKKKFLLFTTGSDRVPVGGMGEMTFKITRITNKPDNLPEAHTCFNQLVLPQYDSADVLREKLIIAISNAEGFGLEQCSQNLQVQTWLLTEVRTFICEDISLAFLSRHPSFFAWYSHIS